jgi:hypothetical protein
MDIAPVLIAVCGLSVICIGVIVIVGFIIIRFTGGNILLPLVSGFLNRDDIIDNITGDDEIDKPKRTPARASGRRSPGGLRSKADSLDFDSAVAKYQQQGGKSPSGKPPLRPVSPPSRFSGQLTDEDESSGKLRRRGRSGEDREIIEDDDDGGFF